MLTMVMTTMTKVIELNDDLTNVMWLGREPADAIKNNEPNVSVNFDEEGYVIVRSYDEEGNREDRFVLDYDTAELLAERIKEALLTYDYIVDEVEELQQFSIEQLMPRSTPKLVIG